MITQVLLEVFEDYPVVAVAFGIAEATKVLETGADIPAAIDVAVQAISEWLRSSRGRAIRNGSYDHEQRPLR
jgi:hypothetical protein